MDNPCFSLLKEMEQGLLTINGSDRNRLNKCVDSIELCQALAIKLRELFLKAELKKTEDQIHFFKQVKPKLYSELTFQIEVNSYYQSKPRGSSRAKKSFIASNIDKVSAFISKHGEFNNYILHGLSHLDELYFTHRPFCPKIHGKLEYPADTEFCSPADPTYSYLLAADRFIQFLKNEEYALTNPTLHPSWERLKSLQWNGSKTDMVEMVYALHALGTIKGELKDAFSILSKTFNLDLGNFYRTYTDIKYKKNPASFLDELKFSLLEKISLENQ